MALLIKGSQFYGEFWFRQERYRVPLGVTVRGQKPKTLSAKGDDDFEASRAAANAVLEDARREFTDPSRAASRLERIHVLATGTEVVHVELKDLFAVWQKTRRRKTALSERHIAGVQTVITRFVDFVAERFPRVRDYRAVTRAIAADFMEADEARGVSAKTYNNTLITLRAAFHAADLKSGGQHNPFAAIPKKDANSIHRTPYSESELQAILVAAKNDPTVGPVVITAICTAMRRRDCASLAWCDVDLTNNEIRTIATKTSERVFVPILAPLRAILETLPTTGPYCFAAAQQMYTVNPDGLNARLKKIVQAAGIQETPIATTAPRLRTASIIGFHRFKTTFVSMALDAGVPMDLVRKVVGNRVVQVVLDNYYKPAKQAVKAALGTKLPRFLTGQEPSGTRAVIEKAILALQQTNESNWAAQTTRALTLLNQALDEPAK